MQADKICKNGQSREIGLVRNKNGEIASSPKEALENLCEAHFDGIDVSVSAR